MNWIDKLIAPLAPSWAAQRAAARHMLEAYEAAKPSRTNRAKAEHRSGDAALFGAGRTLRGQARWLDENHDLVVGLLDNLVTNVVGRNGIGVEPMPFSRTGELHQALAKQISDAWSEWSVLPTTDQQLTVKLKGEVDGEYDRRAKAFMKRSVDAGKPFYLYHNHSLMHFPMEVRPEFKGKSTNGNWGDSLLMLDHDFGSILDYLKELGIEDNTIVIMAGDNGAEDHLAGRGTAGFFDGSYFSSAEGGIRTPCLIRWPGHVPVRESNEMVHVTDPSIGHDAASLLPPAQRQEGA